MLSTSRSTNACATHTFTFFSLFAATAFANAAPSLDSMDSTRLAKRALTYVGCYSSSTPLTETNTYQFQSQGYCQNACDGTVLGLTNGDTCYCGTEIPADSDKVDDSKCDTECTGWGQSNCGGDGFWTVYTTESGVETYSVSSSSDSSDSNDSSGPTSSAAPAAAPASTKEAGSSAPTTPAALSIVTSEVSGGSTVVLTVTPTFRPETTAAATANSNNGGGGGTNTAGIAAGVVVGVVALAGIVAGVYLLLRRRKQRQAEEDFKQRNQVADFMRGSNERKPPGTGYSAMSDSRLDPEAGRRNSAGSLADNQDYSRRILRVANPDSS